MRMKFDKGVYLELDYSWYFALYHQAIVAKRFA